MNDRYSLILTSVLSYASSPRANRESSKSRSYDKNLTIKITFNEKKKTKGDIIGDNVIILPNVIHLVGHEIRDSTFIHIGCQVTKSILIERNSKNR